MNEIKKFGIPATLAIAGAKATELVGFKHPIAALVASIVGAGFGLYVASKV